ncbi:whirlin isoform X1 [Vespula maculifrons]
MTGSDDFSQRGVPGGCCRPGRLVDVEGDPLGVTGPLLPRDNQEYRSPSEDSGLGADIPRTRVTCRRAQQHQVTTSDLALSNDDECDNQDYEDDIDNGRGRRHSSPGGSRGNPRDYGHHHLHPDNLNSVKSEPLVALEKEKGLCVRRLIAAR